MAKTTGAMARNDTQGGWATNDMATTDTYGDRARTDTIGDGIPNIEKVQDRGWAWVVAFAAMANQVIGIGMFRASGIVVVELMDVFEAPASKASFVYFSAALGFAASALLYVCGIGEYVHERGLVAASAFLASLGYVITYFSTRIEHVFVQAFLSGVASQIGMASGLEIVGRYFTRRRAIANSIVMAGVSLGVLVLPPITQWLLDEYSYRGTALVSAAFVLNSLVCGALMRPFRVPHKPKETITNHSAPGTELNHNDQRTAGAGNNDQEAIELPVNKSVQSASHLDDKTQEGISNAAYTHGISDACSKPPHQTQNRCLKSEGAAVRQSCFETTLTALQDFVLKTADQRLTDTRSPWQTLFLGALLFRQPLVVCFEVFTFFATMGTECLLQFYPASTKEFGMSDYQTAFLLSIVGIGDLLSRLILGLLGDCNLMARYKLVAIPQIVLGSACLLSRFATVFWSQAMFAVVIGLTYGVGYAFRGVLIFDFFGLQDLSRLLGICNVIGGFALVAGGPLIGYTRDMTGDYKVAMLVLGAAFYLGGFILLVNGALKWFHGRKSKPDDVE